MLTYTLRLGSLAALLSLPLAACGSPNGDDTVDPPVTGTYHHYVGNTLLLPSNASQATMYGLDLDGDAQMRPDNKLGGILGMLGGFGVELQPQVDEAIMMGDIVLLHAVRAETLTNSNASWQVYLGESATPPTFDGTDVFTIPTDGPQDALLAGRISGGSFAGGPGTVQLKLAFVDGAEPLTLNLIASRIEGTLDETSCDARLGGALTKDDIDNTLIPAVAGLVNTSLADDPVDCDCATGSVNPCPDTSCTIKGLFDAGISCDAPEDCPAPADACTEGKCACTAGDCMGLLANDNQISVAEVQNNAIIKTALGPDIDLLDASGVFQEDPADRDGMIDSVSLGVKFSCVNAVFTSTVEQ